MVEQAHKIGEYTASVRVNGRSFVGMGWTPCEAIRNLRDSVPLGGVVIDFLDIQVEREFCQRRTGV